MLFGVFDVVTIFSNIICMSALVRHYFFLPSRACIIGLALALFLHPTEGLLLQFIMSPSTVTPFGDFIGKAS